MERMSLEQLDRHVGEWLRDERSARAPERLVEDVFTRTSRTRQVRRWRGPWSRGLAEAGRRPPVRFAAGLGGVAAVFLVVVAIGFVVNPAIAPGPGNVPISSPSPAFSPGPSREAPSPSVSPGPVPTTLGTLPARSLFLGTDAAPIAVTEAFGSIWVANIHANDVRRYDPDTLAQIARIPAQSAAWFAVADGALWVTHQTDVGVSRIDPDTNTVVANVGDVPPCAAPVVAFESLWQSACDAGVILRIDPTTNEILDRIPSEGYLWLAMAGDRLIALGSKGIAALDPERLTLTPLPNPDVVDGESLAFDGETLWVQMPTGLLRVDPETGRTIASLDYPGVRAIAFANGSAWLTTDGEGVTELDLVTGEARRTIPVPGNALLPFVTGETLWATDFNNSRLWRVDL
jgi:DNA-binding beta-propeller fold protein YncE